MYCQNCGTKLPNKRTKYCPSCGVPIVYDKKQNPVIDAIILGGIIVFFIFAIVKITSIVTEYKIKANRNNAAVSLPKETGKNYNPQVLPEVAPPRVSGIKPFSSKNPILNLKSRLNAVLRGYNNEMAIIYSKTLRGYEVKIKIYHTKNRSFEDYVNVFARVLSACYDNPENNVKFVVCNVFDKNDIKLSVAVGALASEKLPNFSWGQFKNNGRMLVQWIKNNETPPNVGKLRMCRFYNAF